MKRTFIARTLKDNDYTFIINDAFYCNPKKAAFLCEQLNKQKYMTFGGDVIWKVFVDDGQWTGRILYRSVLRGEHLYFYEIDSVWDEYRKEAKQA